MLLFQVSKLEAERDQWKNCFEPLKKKLREVEESESGMRIALEKAERDAKTLRAQNNNLAALFGKADADAKKAETTVKALESKFKVSYGDASFFSIAVFLIVMSVLNHQSREIISTHYDTTGTERAPFFAHILMENLSRETIVAGSILVLLYRYLTMPYNGQILPFVRRALGHKKGGDKISTAREALGEVMFTKVLKLSQYLRLQREIEQLRRMNKQLDEDLKNHRELSKKTEVSFMGDLECVRKELSRACKNNQDLEVTNSELKEEVSGNFEVIVTLVLTDKVC